MYTAILFATLASLSAVHSSPLSRQLESTPLCGAAEIEILAGVAVEPKDFCAFWQIKPRNPGPIAGLTPAQIDETCYCVLNSAIKASPQEDSPAMTATTNSLEAQETMSLEDILETVFQDPDFASVTVQRRPKPRRHCAAPAHGPQTVLELDGRNFSMDKVVPAEQAFANDRVIHLEVSFKS